MQEWRRQECKNQECTQSTPLVILSEAKNLSVGFRGERLGLNSAGNRREILRFAQNDKRLLVFSGRVTGNLVSADGATSSAE